MQNKPKITKPNIKLIRKIDQLIDNLESERESEHPQHIDNVKEYGIDCDISKLFDAYD